MKRDPSKEAVAPWEDPLAIKWINSFDSWHQMTRLIHGTLKLAVREHSHEIRAAASLVVMLCRENLWPVKEDGQSLDVILDLAAKQLSLIKHRYEAKARIDPKLKTNPKYRALMESLDHEIRILEARVSDPKPQMPNEPPSSWGKFWTAESATPKKK